MVVGSMTIETELLVIGAGPGGYVAAIRAAQKGMEVTLLDKNHEVGGVCLNTGCIPTKALIHASNYVSELQHLEEMGIKITGYEVDYTKMNSWKNNMITKLDQGIKNTCQKYGIEIIQGKGTFVSNNQVHVEGKSDVTEIKFKKAIIATGSTQIEIPNFPFSNENIITSDNAVDVEKLPKKIVVIGGGYIGTELGTVYGKLGSEVHILEAQDRLLMLMDEDLVSVITKKLSDFNVKVHGKTKALGFSEKNNELIVEVEENGEKKEITTEKVLVVVGRRPNSKNLGLENTKVKITEKGFIQTKETMQTTQENIYAIGDVVGNPMLAHKASREAKVAVEHMTGENSAFDNVSIPLVVFDDPEISSTGLTKKQATEKGIKVEESKFPFTALGRAFTLNKTEGFVKIVYDENQIIRGVHIVGPGAADMISEASLAIEMGATLEDLALTIHPHPTLPEALAEAAEVALRTSVHYTKK